MEFARSLLYWVPGGSRRGLPEPDCRVIAVLEGLAVSLCPGRGSCLRQFAGSCFDGLIWGMGPYMGLQGRSVHGQPLPMIPPPSSGWTSGRALATLSPRNSCPSRASLSLAVSFFFLRHVVFPGPGRRQADG